MINKKKIISTAFIPSVTIVELDELNPKIDVKNIIKTEKTLDKKVYPKFNDSIKTQVVIIGRERYISETLKRMFSREVKWELFYISFQNFTLFALDTLFQIYCNLNYQKKMSDLTLSARTDFNNDLRSNIDEINNFCFSNFGANFSAAIKCNNIFIDINDFWKNKSKKPFNQFPDYKTNAKIQIANFIMQSSFFLFKNTVHSFLRLWNQGKKIEAQEKSVNHNQTKDIKLDDSDIQEYNSNCIKKDVDSRRKTITWISIQGINVIQIVFNAMLLYQMNKSLIEGLFRWENSMVNNSVYTQAEDIRCFNSHNNTYWNYTGNFLSVSYNNSNYSLSYFTDPILRANWDSILKFGCEFFFLNMSNIFLFFYEWIKDTVINQDEDNSIKNSEESFQFIPMIEDEYDSSSKVEKTDDKEEIIEIFEKEEPT